MDEKTPPEHKKQGKNKRNERKNPAGKREAQNYCVKFQKEAINLSRLDHPNIVRVTDSFSENGTFYYVMDYIEGQNLNDYASTDSPRSLLKERSASRLSLAPSIMVVMPSSSALR